MLRVDAAIARAVSPWFKNSKPADFMPWPRDDDDDTPATPEQVLAFLTARVKKD